MPSSWKKTSITLPVLPLAMEEAPEAAPEEEAAEPAVAPMLCIEEGPPASPPIAVVIAAPPAERTQRSVTWSKRVRKCGERGSKI